MALAYYNEIDPFAAQWLRNLIDKGLIAPGDVDERSIEDVRPSDLAGYAQCHFFAGIGGWSYALRLAGWPDDRPVWTGSCPCQPFSAAGKERGFADERHLWPAWNHLVRECRPPVIFGEQVEAAIRHGWLDLVQADLEGEGYRFGAAGLPAAGVGAGHGRARLWFVAESECQRPQCEPKQRCSGLLDAMDAAEGSREPVGAYGASDGGVADSEPCERGTSGIRGRCEAVQETGAGTAAQLAGDSEALDVAYPNGHGTLGPRAEEQVADAGCAAGDLAHPEHDGHGRARADAAQPRGDGEDGGVSERGGGGLCSTLEDPELSPSARLGQHGGTGIREQEADGLAGPSSLGGWWRDAEWLWCRDQRYRPVEPGIEQMADGLSESLGRISPTTVEKVTEEIIKVYGDENRAGEAVFNLRKALSKKAMDEWNIRRFDGVQQAPVLLSFLCQLSEQGWPFAKGISRSRKKATREMLRSVRIDGISSCTSCGRELDKQRADECSNSLHVLSSLLARHAQTEWGEAFDKNAAATFPLMQGAFSRVGRLRGYGNSIVPQVAEQFIRAYCEAREEGR